MARTLSRKLLVALFAGAVGVLGLLVWLLPRDEPSPTQVAASPTQPAAVEPSLLPSVPLQPSEALEPESLVPNERLEQPVPLGGGRGPRQPVAIRVLDAAGHGVPGALVRAWTRDVEHPLAKELKEGRDSYLARFAHGTDATSLALWSIAAHADPTWGEPDSSTETDSSGSCSLQLPRGRAIILATRGQQTSGPWIDDPWQAFTQPSGAAGSSDEPPAPLVLALRPISQLIVRVVDENHKPIEGAAVYVWSHDLFDRPVRWPPPARTDAEGQCSFDLDAPIEVQVCAQRGPEWSGRHTASIHEPVEGPLIVRVGTPCAIEGTVLDPHGQPTRSATVLARGPSGEIERTTSSDDGRFHLPVGESGPWTIGANRDRWLADQIITANVERFGGPVTVELRLAEPGRITGVVLWEDSSPASDIQVDAISLDLLKRGPPSPYGESYRTTRTGEDGLFLLDHLSGSENYTVYVYGVHEPIDASAQSGVRAGQDLEIHIKRSRTVGGPLVGTVIDHATLEPIPVFSVRLTDSSRGEVDDFGPVAWQSIRDDAGRFRLDTGRRRSGHLWVSAAGHEPTRMGPLTFSPDETTVEIALEPSLR